MGGYREQFRHGKGRAREHTHTHAHAQTDRQTDRHTNTDTDTQTQTQTHTHRHTHTHTHTHARARARARAHKTLKVKWCSIFRLPIRPNRLALMIMIPLYFVENRNSGDCRSRLPSGTIIFYCRCFAITSKGSVHPLVLSELLSTAFCQVLSPLQTATTADLKCG